MGIASAIKWLFSRTEVPSRPVVDSGVRHHPIHARYDAAQDSPQHRNYWAAADSYDADSANSRSVRHKLVTRSRYEVGNNGYADGMTQTHVNYLVGTGPALRMKTGSQRFNRMVEKEWGRWAKAVQLRRKLWTMAHAKLGDGEAFGVAKDNPNVRHQVKLDFCLVETEQCQTPRLPHGTVGYIDGIEFDDFGNPHTYDILPHHPGGQFTHFANEPDRVPAEFILHWFQLRRPGQHRGVPEFKSTLNVGAGSRRFREATIAAAETAANHAGVLSTGFQPDTIDQVRPLSEFEIDKNMMTALPMGWSMEQMRAEHPNATYESFNRAQISEQGRPKSIPYNVAAADSSKHNFASGKLDHLTWFRGIEVERQDGDDLVLDPLFRLWFFEASLVFGWVWSQEFEPAHEWSWPPLPVADEKSRAIANKTNLETGVVSPSDVVNDIDDHIQKLAADYGISEDEARQRLLKRNLGGGAARSPDDSADGESEVDENEREDDTEFEDEQDESTVEEEVHV